MDPSAMEFVMQPNRIQSDRPPEQTGSQQASLPRCEGQSVTSFDNNMTSTSSSPPRTVPAYDPVHNGYHATYYRPPPGSYVPNLHGWNHQSVSTAPRVGGPVGDTLPLPNGSAGFRPSLQHIAGGGYHSFASIHSEHSTSTGAFFHSRASATYLPHPNPVEPSFSHTPTRNSTGHHQDSSLGSLPPLSPITPSREGADHMISPSMHSRTHHTNSNITAGTAAVSNAPAPAHVGRADPTAQLRLTRPVTSSNSPPAATRSTREPSVHFYNGWETGWGGVAPLTYSPNRVRPTNVGFSAHMSESSSDEDPEMEPSDVGSAFGYPSGYHSTAGGRIRAQQFAQGQPPARRVASTKALTSLEKVEISDLPESERTCVICYNDFDVETPEGNKETPLRLPKCKHVFGDHCIKKWFEENDTCPYCRDKVPSEPQFGGINIQQYIRRHHLHTRLPSQDAGTDSLHLRVRNGAHGSDPHPNISEASSRRSDGLPAPSWSSRPRSPSNDTYESRRRTRVRHGGSRGSPPSNRSASYGVNPPYIAYSQPGPSRNYPTTNPYRHFGGLPSLSNTLGGYTGEDLDRYMLRPPPTSMADSPATHSLSSAAPVTQLGSRSRTEVHQTPSSLATPLSPTISGPEINMGMPQ